MMFETHPKFSLFLVATLLVAALVLPAVIVFPSGGFQTAGGVQIALMLWVLWVIGMILRPKASDAFEMMRFPLALIAAVAALGFSPQDGVMDVITNYNFLPMLIVLGAGIAYLRPKTLGFSVNRQFWVILAALAIVLGFNHLWRFRDAQGAALVADLVVLAAMANFVPFGQSLSQEKWGIRALNVLSFALFLGLCGSLIDNLPPNQMDAVDSAIFLVATFVILWPAYPWLERQSQPK